MGIESEVNSNNPIVYYYQRALSIEKVEIRRSAAQALGISYRIIPNEEISDPCARAREGEAVIRVDYENRRAEFWNKVNELSPPPPPKPRPVSSDLLVGAEI